MKKYFTKKITRASVLLKKYSLPYLCACVLRKLKLSFLLHPSNKFIDRGQYRIVWKDEPLLNDFFVNPKMIREDETFLKAFLKKGDTYIDVGANIGTTTICAAQSVGVTGKVIAFEPHQETFISLRKNLVLNKIKNVLLFNLALGEKEDRLFLTSEYASDINHIATDGDTAVEVKTLDAMLSDVEKINLLKIDVEGFEEAVFKGALQTLKKTDVVFFESMKSQYDRYGFSFKTIFNILISEHFHVYTLLFTTKGITFTEINDAGYISDGCENLCASKDAVSAFIPVP